MLHPLNELPRPKPRARGLRPVYAPPRVQPVSGPSGPRDRSPSSSLSPAPEDSEARHPLSRSETLAVKWRRISNWDENWVLKPERRRRRSFSDEPDPEPALELQNAILPLTDVVRAHQRWIRTVETVLKLLKRHPDMSDDDVALKIRKDHDGTPKHLHRGRAGDLTKVPGLAYLGEIRACTVASIRYLLAPDKPYTGSMEVIVRTERGQAHAADWWRVLIGLGRHRSFGHDCVSNIMAFYQKHNIWNEDDESVNARDSHGSICAYHLNGMLLAVDSTPHARRTRF